MRAGSACRSRRSCSRARRPRYSAAWTLGLRRQETRPPSPSISGRPSSACCPCGSTNPICPGRPSPSKPIVSWPSSSDWRCPDPSRSAQPGGPGEVAAVVGEVDELDVLALLRRRNGQTGADVDLDVVDVAVEEDEVARLELRVGDVP